MLAMLVAGLAVTLGVTGPTADAQRAARPSPRVHTTSKTITIHRPASAPAVTYAAAATTAGGVGGDDANENDDASGSGGGFESEDGFGSVATDGSLGVNAEGIDG